METLPLLPRLDIVIVILAATNAIAIVLIFVPSYVLPCITGAINLSDSISCIPCQQDSALGLTDERHLCEIWKAEEKQK